VSAAQHASVQGATHPAGSPQGRPVVIKLGGAALPHREAVLDDLRQARQAGYAPILVHGGGPVISAWLQRLGKEPVFVGGLRQTDAETLDVAVMALAGKVNTDLVAVLQGGGTPAIGLSGVDGGFIRARRQTEPDLGFVGVVEEVDPRPLTALACAGYVPVIAPIALGPQGPLNINADTVAGDIARAVSAVSLLFLTDVPGVKDRAGNVLPALDRATTLALQREGVISGGMIPKVEACLRALDRVPQATILDGGRPHAIVEHLLDGRTPGTVFTAS
jgi:acetylglutamate kinase